MSVYFFIRTTTTFDPQVPVVANNQADFNRNVSYAFSSLVGGYGEAGNVILRASLKAIPFHALCDGAAVSRRGLAELFDIIGTTFGAGDGSITFNLPTQAQIAQAIADRITAPAPPAQVIEGGTVSSGTTPQEPETPGQVGGVQGGSVPSGERPQRPPLGDNEQLQ